MKIHSGSKTCPASRGLLVRRVLEQGQDRRVVAQSLGISLRTVQSWLRRYRLEGQEGLLDRSSAPRSPHSRWPMTTMQRIVELRRTGLTAVSVASSCGVPRSTVGRVLRRHRLSRHRDIQPKEPVRRYEHEAPGDLLHADIKKLGRIARPGHRVHGDRRTRVRGIGWEFAHVCIDDHSRLAYVEVLPDERRHTTTGFLKRAFDFFAAHGAVPRRLLTDNGPAYRSSDVRRLCDAWHVRHGFTKPYRPRTNGKAERFIQTALREWAYRRPYSRSAQRRLWLPRWLHFYNQHRPHSALKGRPPASRVNNLVGSNS
jgi:transposase InsO family protein